MSPSPNWYEPADLIDVDPDPLPDSEILTIGATSGWWSSALQDSDAD